MINLVLLAAGYSSRFGENKLLFEIEGIPMYRHIFDRALFFQKTSAEPVRVILVTAYEAIGEYAARQAGFLQKKASEADHRILVYNRNQAAGISHSIILGIEAALSGDNDTVKHGIGEDCIMFAVCDQPYLKSRDLLSLTEGFKKSGKGIGCMAYGGRSGNPVIFKKRYIGELLRLTGDLGGKSIVKAHKEDVFFYETENGLSLKDIDRKEDGS